MYGELPNVKIRLKKEAHIIVLKQGHKQGSQGHKPVAA